MTSRNLYRILTLIWYSDFYRIHYEEQHTKVEPNVSFAFSSRFSQPCRGVRQSKKFSAYTFLLFLPFPFQQENLLTQFGGNQCQCSCDHDDKLGRSVSSFFIKGGTSIVRLGCSARSCRQALPAFAHSIKVYLFCLCMKNS